MRNLIAYFIKYPIYANAIIIITAIAGFLSLTMMPKSFFPELPPNKIYINVSYPGASPQEIEHGITTRIEESLSGIEGVEEITSTSSENVSNVTVEVGAGFEIDDILQNVKNSVDAIYSLPKGAEKPTVEKQKSRDHTENILVKNPQVVKIINSKKKMITIFGKKKLKNLNINVPGDPSSAAFLQL